MSVHQERRGMESSIESGVISSVEPDVAPSSVPQAIERIAAGGFAIVVDDEDRENEGDLIMAAEMATAETIGFMVRHTSGVICAPCEPERLDALQMPLMVDANQEAHRCAFTVSADYLPGMTTGISAAERAATLRALADPDVRAHDFVRPGHIFPLRYQPGGVLVRTGHTEAAVDLARLAGLQPAGVLCELVHDDGSMMRMPALREFAAAHDLPLITIDALIRYRAEHDRLVVQRSSATIRLLQTDFSLLTWGTCLGRESDARSIVVLVKGEIDGDQPTLVRVVKGRADRDLLASASEPGNVIHRTLELIAGAEQGVFIYLPPDDAVLDPGGPIWRQVGIGSAILRSLGVRRIHLLASRQLSFAGVASFGLRVETVIKEA